jgi:hypothetical protein
MFEETHIHYIINPQDHTSTLCYHSIYSATQVLMHTGMHSHTITHAHIYHHIIYHAHMYTGTHMHTYAITLSRVPH